MKRNNVGLWTLVLSHAFIAWCVLTSGLGLEDATWLYWYGVLFFIAGSAWRMHRSWYVERWELPCVIGFFGLVQWLLWAFLGWSGYVVDRSPEFGIALAGMFGTCALELRRQLKLDAKDAPSGGHFAALWALRILPLGMMFFLPAMLADLLLAGGPRLLAVFLAAVATIDVLLYRLEPSFGRSPLSEKAQYKREIERQRRQNKEFSDYCD